VHSALGALRVHFFSRSGNTCCYSKCAPGIPSIPGTLGTPGTPGTPDIPGTPDTARSMGRPPPPPTAGSHPPSEGTAAGTLSAGPEVLPHGHQFVPDVLKIERRDFWPGML